MAKNLFANFLGFNQLGGLCNNRVLSSVPLEARTKGLPMTLGVHVFYDVLSSIGVSGFSEAVY